MIEIDGSKGEGGGQIVRSSLALSALTGQAFTILNVRAGRAKPGLMRQHLVAVNATQEICNAKVKGAKIGSSKIEFQPNKLCGGSYEFKVDTAGSVTLVAQTILPALMCADEESRISLTGGTHNMAAPPFDFLEQVYLPIVTRMGPKFESELTKFGFYPQGGGHFSVSISPCKLLSGIEILENGGDLSPSVKAIVSKIPISIAQRECDAIRKKTNWEKSIFEAIEVTNSPGPGNVVMIKLAGDNVTEVFTGFGKLGIRAEQVARGVLREALKHMQTGVPVGPHLADQLMLPMGLAAVQGQTSRFRTFELTGHGETHIKILKKFSKK